MKTCVKCRKVVAIYTLKNWHVINNRMEQWTLVSSDAGKLFDINGNGVGMWRVDET